MTPTIEDVLRKYMLNDGRADIIYFEDAVKAMTEYASLNRQGCRWVKLSERKPILSGDEEIVFRDYEGAKKLAEFWNYYDPKKTLEELLLTQWEWLDESIEPCATSSENYWKQRCEELEGWKESAVSVMPDIQAIGKEMGLQIGQAISPKILPYIKELKAEATMQKEKQASLVKEIKQMTNATIANYDLCHLKQEEIKGLNRIISRLFANSVEKSREIERLQEENKQLKSQTPSPTGDRDCEEFMSQSNIPSEIKEKIDEAGMKMFPDWANAQSGHSDLYERFIQAAEYGYSLASKIIEKWENEAKEAWRKIEIYKDESDRYKNECTQQASTIAYLEAEKETQIKKDAIAFKNFLSKNGLIVETTLKNDDEMWELFRPKYSINIGRTDSDNQ